MKAMTSAALAATILAAGAPAAFAAPLATSGDIDFNGAIGLACSFSSETDGALGASANNTVLSSKETGGASGAVTVTANGDVEVTFTAASFTNSPSGFSAGAATTKLDVGAGFLTGDQTVAVNAGSKTIDVDALAESSAIFPAGDYTLTTVATCAAPQIAQSGGGDGGESDRGGD
ncbi:MAG: hypothetical protein AAFR16_01410 [Pseudomonadota bacterium]